MSTDILAYRWGLTQQWREFHAVSQGSDPKGFGSWRHVGYMRDFIERNMLLPGVQRRRDDESKARHAAYLASRARDTSAPQLEMF